MNRDPNENRLTDKVILVTGAASGVGKAIAKRCAYLGAKGIILTDQNVAGGKETQEQIQTIGSEVIFIPADLTIETDCREIVAQSDRAFGRVDGLVNAAGRGTRGRLANTTVELWDEMLNLHVRAPFLLTQSVTEIMRREKIGGSIVNIGSINAHGGDPAIMAYSVAKGALMTFTKSAAFELQKDRIRVFCLNIGWTATEQEHIIQTENGQPENWLEAADKTMPFDRLARPEDIAPIVTFLLSNQAILVTGSIIEWDQKMVLGPYGK